MASPKQTDTQLIQVFTEYRREAEEARHSRMLLNKRNWDAYYGYQDFSHKMEGQSTEFLPKMAQAAEQMRAFVKRALVQFGDWFSVETAAAVPLTPEQIRALMRRFLDRIYTARDQTEPFVSLVGKAVLQGLFESLIIVKIHGYNEKRQSYTVEPGNFMAGIPAALNTREERVWCLRMDLIPSEDYFPDPTGRNLYEIHEVERDFADVLAMADAGVYDKAVVDKINFDYNKEASSLNRRAPRHRGQNETVPPKFRRRVKVSELWGTILGPDGRPYKENCVMTIADDKYIIRPPMDNPMWHRESPIVKANIVNVPHAVWGKAFYDHTAALNIALNELYNLILDGGISSVWGVREVREHYLANPAQISNGIPAGATLLLNEDAPEGQSAVEVTATGKVDQSALVALNLTSSELDASAMTNDTRMGFLPQRQVKATEIVSANDSHSVLLDSFTGDLEVNFITEVLRKSWLTIIQNADDLDADDIVDTIGVDAAFTLSRMSPAQRFAAFAKGAKFRVNGLTATLARGREFQKLMALMQSVQTNPILFESFQRRLNGDKALDTLLRSLNINPESFQLTPEEQRQTAERTQRMVQLAPLMQLGQGQPTAPAAPGGDAMSGMRGQIAQDAEPSGGLGT